MRRSSDTSTQAVRATTLSKEMTNYPLGSSSPAGHPESPSAARQDRRSDPRGLLLSPRRQGLELYRAAPIDGPLISFDQIGPSSLTTNPEHHLRREASCRSAGYQ
jgi:hypothetical protein